ncbi:hypothetical protein ACQ4LE_009696 [Meloidogyne hapla]
MLEAQMLEDGCVHCAALPYGFGPSGCSPCDCDSVGALSNVCDKQSGQCVCNERGITGRQCKFWNFLECLTGQCKGHASICDQRTVSVLTVVTLPMEQITLCGCILWTFQTGCWYSLQGLPLPWRPGSGCRFLPILVILLHKITLLFVITVMAILANIVPNVKSTFGGKSSRNRRIL